VEGGEYCPATERSETGNDEPEICLPYPSVPIRMALLPLVSIRYPVSKLLQILLARAMAKRLVDADGKPTVVVNSFTPGYTHSSLMNNAYGVTASEGALPAKNIARKTEVGSRALAAAVSMDAESHGKSMNDSETDEYVFLLLLSGIQLMELPKVCIISVCAQCERGEGTGEDVEGIIRHPGDKVVGISRVLG
jgi:hypothetical protein